MNAKTEIVIMTKVKTKIKKPMIETIVIQVIVKLERLSSYTTVSGNDCAVRLTMGVTVWLVVLVKLSTRVVFVMLTTVELRPPIHVVLS